MREPELEDRWFVLEDLTRKPSSILTVQGQFIFLTQLWGVIQVS